MTSLSLSAQSFYFSKDYYADSSLFVKALPELARQIQDSITISNQPLSANNKMHVSMVAEAYESALTHVETMRQPFKEDYKVGIFTPFEDYAKAKQNQSATTPFQHTLEAQILETYSSLNVASQEVVEGNSLYPVQNLRMSFDATKEKHKTSDTLKLQDALLLISSYNYYQVYNQTSSAMQKVIKEYNHKTYEVETTIVETQNGGKLRTHVVRKKGIVEKLPTVFIFNIYADSLIDIGIAKYYAAKNYVCVVANTRGKGISEHEIAPFEFDGSDAYGLIDWISKQPWSNGEVGMVGGSYLGFSQWAALKTLHPSLKTILPQVSVGPGIDYPMNGNVFMSYMLRWIQYVTSNATTDYADFSNAPKWNSLYKKWYKQGTSFSTLDSLEGRPSAVFQRWLDHPSFDAFWQNMVPYKTDFSCIDIPILTTTGYFDDDQMGALYYYKQHHVYHPNANHYLVIGPYNHSGAQTYPQKIVGGYAVDSVATAFNFRALSVEWFDYVMKDAPIPGLLKDRVNYQIMGTNTWGHASELSGISNDSLTFYFDKTRSDGFYTLSQKPNSDYLEQEVDFTDRSDDTEFAHMVIKDSITSDITNSISFISEPFDEALILSGAFISSLKVAINKKDVDIVIRAYELMPDGRYFALFTDSGFSALQRASYAKDNTHRQLLTPNKKETIEINTSYITSKQLSQGSRLVIALGVNKSPYWQINYGTGKDVSDETIQDAGESLRIKWFGDSFIKIPILTTDD
ncbi:MAG: CocE/NonD family hydrolase [Saprospiraceae bacterium]|nr:CocE/NonD family hydrolase [Saprospiraceae bacterium]